MSQNKNNINEQLESSITDAINKGRRESRILNAAISDYLKHSMHKMKQKWYIGDIKIENNMRILTMNINRYRPENYKRLKSIKEAITKYKINIALFNEANTK